MFALIVLTFHGLWGSTFVLHYSVEEEAYLIFDVSFKGWFQDTSLFQDSELWKMIGTTNNEMQWLITPTIDNACKMITLIYTSRCQKDSEPLQHMHYTGTIFSYKPFNFEQNFVPAQEIYNWIGKVQQHTDMIPRSLLFAQNEHNLQICSIPTVELEAGLQKESQGTKG